MRWFEVAVYGSWWANNVSTGQLEDCSAYVQASSPFAAVEGLMRHHGLRYASYVVAYAEDRSIIYRGYQVCVKLNEPSRIGEIVGYEVWRTRRKSVWSSKKGGAEREYAVYPFA